METIHLGGIWMIVVVRGWPFAWRAHLCHGSVVIKTRTRLSRRGAIRAVTGQDKENT